jgi:hypothetical protein
MKVDDLGMNPPTEQLIRDFLNRLSLAARGHLGLSERKSLLDQTRTRIEADCGDLHTATSVQVRKVLANLGDPIAIVERARSVDKSESRGESVTAVDATEPAQPPASPAVPPVQVPAPRPGLSASARLIVKGERKMTLEKGVEPGEPALFAAPDEAAPDDAAPGESAPRRAAPADRVQGQPGRSQAPSPNAEPRRQRLGGAAATGAGALARLACAARTLARGNPVEILAVLLLGIGGAVYPPIWILGVLVALPSKKWDVRDKFIGIVLPVLLVIFGTVLVLAFGGQHSSLLSYGHEAWLGAERIGRLTALAGAAYLLWALRRSRRKPSKQPPWRLSPRFG